MDQISEIRLFPPPFRNHQAWVRFAILLIAGHGILVTPSLADTHYVSLSGGHVAPFTNWVDAATNIQDAIDASTAGDLVLVSNGVYATGGRVIHGSMTNRVAIHKAVTVRSLNGADVTFIVGAADPFTTNGNAAIRCVYMTNGSVLAGFTITNGHTRTSGDVTTEQSGGGIYAQAIFALVSNCVITGNSALSGGGSRNGTLRNCVYRGNYATIEGGGANFGTLNQCYLLDNRAGNFGGGARNANLYGCVIRGNYAFNGGGVSAGQAHGCTIVQNLATNGGGVGSGTISNCIVYYNSAINGVNIFTNTAFVGYSCVTPSIAGTQNITNEPRIASLKDPRLLPNSPCIDAGISNAWMAGYFDLDGEARINGIPDMGADEFYEAGLTGQLDVAINTSATNIMEGGDILFTAQTEGRIQGYVWKWPDGGEITNEFRVNRVFPTSGTHVVDLVASNLSVVITASVSILVQSVPVGFTFDKTLIDTPQPVLVGSNVRFRIVAANTGNVAISTMRFEDSFDPFVLNFSSAIPTPDATGLGTLTWSNLGPVASGGSVTVTAIFTAVTNTWPNATTNTAIGSAVTTNALNLPSITSSVSVVVSSAPPLAVGFTLQKTLVSPSPPVIVGSSIVFRITLNNTGLVALGTARVDDLFDQAVFNFASAIPTPDSTGLGTLTWSNLGPVASGGSVTVTAIFTAVTNTWPNATTNTAVGSAITTNALTLPSITSSVSVIVSSAPPLAVGFTLQKTLVSPSPPVIVGSSIVFRITLNNTGLVALGTARVDDLFDQAVFSFTSAIPTPDATGAGTLTWSNLGPVASGGSVTVTAIFTAVTNTWPGATTNSAIGSAVTTNALTLPSITSSVSVIVSSAPPPSVGFTLQKTLVNPQPTTIVGSGVVFQITLNNTGETALSSVRLDDYYDTAVLSMFEANPAPDAVGGGLITWSNLGPVTAGGSITITSSFTAIGATWPGSTTNRVVGSALTTNAELLGPITSIVSMITTSSPTPVAYYELYKSLVSHTNYAPVLSVMTFEILIFNYGEVPVDVGRIDDFFDPLILNFQHATRAPDISGSGFLTWSNLGVVGVGEHISITSSFTAIDITWPIETTNSALSYVTRTNTMALPAQTGSVVFAITPDETIYVAPSGNDTNSGLSWAMAKETIQAAIDIAAPGNIVLVSNGVYEIGGRVVDGLLTNRVVITKPITVRSVNGPEVTIIKGVSTFNDSAVRCVYIDNDGILDGFTLTNGSTRNNFYTDNKGGGALNHGTLKNCKVSGNSAYYGGGVSHGALYDCEISDNYAVFGGGGVSGITGTRLYIHNNDANFYIGGSDFGSGGGAYQSTLLACIIENNKANSGGGLFEGSAIGCFVTRNLAWVGGGTTLGTFRNCTFTHNEALEYGGGILLGENMNTISYFNTAPTRENYYDGTFINSCSTPLPPGQGNITNEPQFSTTYRISLNSPCREAGSSTYTQESDIDGETWQNPPSIGCDEIVPSALTGSLHIVISPQSDVVVTNFNVIFRGEISGRAASNRWFFGEIAGPTNNLLSSFAWSTPGVYIVEFRAYNLDHPLGVAATVQIHVVSAEATATYAWTNSPAPMHPYTNWTTAARILQEAVDAQTVLGGWVIATDGVYSAGGRISPDGFLTNRLVITNHIVVKSVNGSQSTFIKGVGPFGNAAIRCVYMSAGQLRGFTLTNGFTRSSATIFTEEDLYGGGVLGGDVHDCMITGNAAFQGGGGAARSTLWNCSIIGNQTPGTGGGADKCVLYNCELRGNLSLLSGGGMSHGSASSSTLLNNMANGVLGGGGAYNSTLTHTFVAYNAASRGPGGGTANCSNFNSIVYHNTALHNQNYYQSKFINSCTTPMPSGHGNITNEPELASTYRISLNSPCRAAGSQVYAKGTDIDGEAWQSPPSMGCDEVYPSSLTGLLEVVTSVQEVRVVTDFPITLSGNIVGRPFSNQWLNGGISESANTRSFTAAWATTGVQEVLYIAYNVDYPTGVAATVLVSVVSAAASATYAWTNSPSPMFPYTNWSTAANVIQDAVDAQTILGGWVIATDGVYSAGGRISPEGALTNRVVITNQIVLKSVNGPEFTSIRGEGPLGDAAIRGVYMSAGQMYGLTITNGHTLSVGNTSNVNGGGVFATNAILMNCILTGNKAFASGGGISGGHVFNSRLSDNQSGSGGGSHNTYLENSVLVNNRATNGEGGGALNSILYGCDVSSNLATSVGGGLSSSTASNCILSGNTSLLRGGGANSSSLRSTYLIANRAREGGGSNGGTLYSCVLYGNAATNGAGGGSYNAQLFNCTVASNSSSSFGGGMRFGSALNCIIISNAAVTLPNYSSATITYSCSAPLPTGVGCISTEPQFEDLSTAKLNLAPTSPCINTGRNEAWLETMTDIAGGPRIAAEKVDMGAHEFRFEANLKGVLAGAHTVTDGLMRTISPLPTNSPYAADATSSAIPISNAVDWIFVQLRPTPTSPPAASASAVLLNDGRVVRSDGGSPVYLEAAGNQHVALYHRNHLAIMSATAVFSNRVSAFDFSADPAHLLGGTNAVVEVDPGVWALIAGDADGDGEILPVDELIWRTQEGEE